MRNELNFLGQLGLAVKSYFKAIPFVFNNGLWVYFLYPIIISVILISGEYALAQSLSDTIEKWIFNLIHLETTESVFFKFVSFFLRIGINIIFFFFYITLNKYILLISMSPVMALLSEKTESALKGKIYTF